MSRLLVVVDVDGDRMPRPGSERFEELREALWEAFDEVGVTLDSDDSGPYGVTVVSLGPAGRDEAKL